ASGQIDGGGGVHRDGGSMIVVAAAEIGAVDEPASIGGQFGDKRVLAPPETPLHSTCREVGRVRVAHDIGVSARVHGDAVRNIRPAAAQVGAVYQRIAGGIQFGDKCVAPPR